MESRMRWTEHIARTAEIKNAYNISVAIYQGSEHLEDLGVAGDNN
jgi:hypothetical protein